MRLQAIRVYSARGACRVDAGKFACFTLKLQVAHVNCVWGLFKSDPQVKLPAFPVVVGRVSFTVSCNRCLCFKNVLFSIRCLHF